MSKSLCGCFSKLFAMPNAAIIVALASLGALIFAFTLQYGFDIQPCVLCLWQRVPLGLAFALGITACIWRPYGRHARILLSLCGFAYFINVGLAFFHTGVEQHWWEGTRGCAITPLHGTTVQDWKEQLMSTVVGHCDQISWTFFGFSMANWNILFSSALAIFCIAAVITQGCKKKR